MTVSNEANLLGLARTAQLAGNQDEALDYFNRVLEIDPSSSEAWLGKGKAAGWLSSLTNIRLSETLIAFNHAIATAREENKIAVTDEAVEEVNRLVAALYGMARRHLEQFVLVPDVWVSYLNQIAQLLDALDGVRAWQPLNRTTLENVIHLCKDNIEGISYNDPYDYNTSKAWHLSPEYERLISGRFNSAIADLRTLDGGYKAPTIEKKQVSDCFVVTAALGNPEDPTVLFLRKFRDEWLAKNTWGRSAISHYYKVGPKLARLIAPSPMLRAVSVVVIVKPCAWIARWLMKAG